MQWFQLMQYNLKIFLMEDKDLQMLMMLSLCHHPLIRHQVIAIDRKTKENRQILKRSFNGGI